MISSVEDQVLAHNGQTDEAEISTGNNVRRCADIDAGETGTIVSDQFHLSGLDKRETKAQNAKNGP